MRMFAVYSCLIALVVGGCGHGMLSDGFNGLTIMSRADEKIMGARLHPKILNKFGGVYKNPELHAKLAHLTERLVRHSSSPDLRYRLTILNSPSINAFALPGGYIYVTRGLLAQANDEAELASVLAHELAHVSARHTAKRHTREVKTKLLNIILGRGGTTPELARTYQVGAGQQIAEYSRTQEYDADRLGITTLINAGISPYGAVSFLGNLARRTQLLADLARQK